MIEDSALGPSRRWRVRTVTEPRGELMAAGRSCGWSWGGLGGGVTADPGDVKERTS